MRTLFLLRGAPASGKSTWIKENSLEAYTLSADKIRLMNESPQQNVDGSVCITQKNDADVWELLLNLLEKRMQNGCFTIIDATHYKAPLINKYKDLVDKYRYRCYIVDFSNITKEELLERNLKRDQLLRVPNEVIEKQVISLKDTSEIKKAYKILQPEEALKMIKEPIPFVKIDDKEKVVIFGDIHGCYDPLKEYFDKNPFNDNYCYIFVGDYLDRGIQNREVLEFLLEIYNKPNVFLLEGNHENWLRIACQDDYNIKDYDNHFNKYIDIFAQKILNELKYCISKNESMIRNYEQEKNLIIKAWEEEKLINKDTKEIFYEFEKINVPKKLKELNDKIRVCSCNIDTYNKNKTILEYTYKQNLHIIKDAADNMIDNLDVKTITYNKKTLLSYLDIDYVGKENPIHSSEFLNNTLPQIQDIIDTRKSDVRQLCRKFILTSCFEFASQAYVVTHGGLSNPPLITTNGIECIKGVGTYGDEETVDNKFYDNTYGIIQIHGHRNIHKLPIKDSKGKWYNLEGKVEFGGNLRIVELNKDGADNCIEIKNNIFRQVDNKQENKPQIIEPLKLLKQMYKSPLVNVKDLGDNILSFNFNRDAFYDRTWNDLTCTARGLFVDKRNGDIVARSYSKFFNYREIDMTKPENLQDSLVFPLIAYKKENGFLGLISKHNGKIEFFTKSTNKGDYRNYFINALCEIYNIYYNNGKNDINYLDVYANACEDFECGWKDGLDGMENRLLSIINPFIEENHTYIFECVDMKNDPHIIKYDKTPQVFLLDVVENRIDKDIFKPYDELVNIAKNLKLNVKSKEIVFNTWEEFADWKTKFRHNETQWDCKFEGYVLEDNNGFRFKMKSSYYSFWKQMRKVLQDLQKGAGLKKIYKDKTEIEVTKMMQNISQETLQELNIIDIQNIYTDRLKEDIEKLYNKIKDYN